MIHFMVRKSIKQIFLSFYFVLDLYFIDNIIVS